VTFAPDPHAGAGAAPVPMPATPGPGAGAPAAAGNGNGNGATGGVELDGVSAYYRSFRAVREVSLKIRPRAVTALIGPSGCGKSTLLRVINRMHETIPGTRSEGAVRLDGVDIYGTTISPVRVRRTIGMVFQKPNPFPAMSIRENVSAGLRLAGERSRSVLDGTVEDCLRRAALWDEVKDKLRQPGTSLSGGQQQRLCIARAIATEPEVILMDEPCSALDPRATLQIEDLMAEIKRRFTIIIVTHNMQQAARASDDTAFLTMGDDRAGYLVETGPTAEIFASPKEQLTEDYVSGRFG
jgi:phosphate transport system ATP-binding protein